MFLHPHPGIRIDSIPAEGAGGLIFALGIVVIVWLGVPALQPLLLGCIIGGLVFAPILHLLGLEASCQPSAVSYQQSAVSSQPRKAHV